MKLQVDVQCACDDEDVPNAEAISLWAQTAADAVLDKNAQLSVRIVDAEEGTHLNESYRRGEGPTNVLSFAFEEGARLEPPLLGDIVICADVVAREAREQDKALSAHYAHMVMHGVLHLLGFDHERERQAQKMESLERQLMSALGFNDPYDNDAETEMVSEHSSAQESVQ